MKKYFLGFWAIMVVLSFSSGAGAIAIGSFITIDDQIGSSQVYYGGSIKPGATSYDDVIGIPNFSVDSLKASLIENGTKIQVVLQGDYFGTDYAKETSPWGHIGDLYISSRGWKVDSPADNARFDTFKQSEGWDYVVSKATGTTGKIYALNFGSITPSGNEGHWSGYRTDQAYTGGYGDEKGSATWELDSTNKTLTIKFDSLGMDPSAIGYHWTMACGNDVVEGGGTPVPEPGTLVLLGLGFLGLVVSRLKK